MLSFAFVIVNSVLAHLLVGADVRLEGAVPETAPACVVWSDDDETIVSDGEFDERWWNDRTGRVHLSQVLHSEQMIIEYVPTDLVLAGLEPPTPAQLPASRATQRPGPRTDAYDVIDFADIGDRHGDERLGKVSEAARGWRCVQQRGQTPD